ncbi:MAG: hypothetical protein DWQ05_08070 [Calditrichaeota bacterium]|nr:MAG: hypothetical protein DWQ05_08070 [Calditrichota bacterium]
MAISKPGYEKYWFPAKKNGLGWELPATWQGWLTVIVYLCMLGLNVYIVPPAESIFLFIFITIILSGLFLLVCWIKGEPLNSSAEKK